MKTTMAVIITMLSVGIAAADDSDLFKAKEKSLMVFGSYVDKHNSDVNLGAGLSYFLTDKIGISATTFWENTSGTFIDNIAGEGIFRLPLRNLPVAPYGLVGIGYSFESEETFEYFGAGGEWRFGSGKFGAFGDIRWQFNNDNSDGVGVRFGLRMVF